MKCEHLPKAVVLEESKETQRLPSMKSGVPGTYSKLYTKKVCLFSRLKTIVNSPKSLGAARALLPVNYKSYMC